MSADAAGAVRHRRGPRPTTVVARVTARRAARSGVGWGCVYGIYVLASAKGYATAYPDMASRLQLARSLGSNAGLAALLGPAHHLDTVAGFTSWRCLGVLTLVGAVWALLTGTRLLRGEEEAGRWELLLAGQTTRRGAAAQAIAGLAAGWAALWAVTAVGTLAAGRTVEPAFPPGDALFLSIALASSAAMFLAIGALASQLAATRRQGASLAAGVLGGAFLLRMVADSSTGLQPLRWASPLGWIEELQPLTDARPLALLPIAALTAAATAVAVRLAGDRDLGASILAAQDSAPARTRLLTGPTGLALRLVRPVALGWTAALAGYGLLCGLVAQSAGSATEGSSSAQEILRRMGAPQVGAAAYLGVTFVLMATLVAVAAAGQVAATREEEEDGRLDNLLVRPVSRATWLAGRLVTGAGLVVLSAAVAGLVAWAGTALQGTGLGAGSVVEAAVATAPPALFVLGLGTLVHGAMPRLAAAVSYGVIAWSFLVELIGSVVNAPRWLLDTSLLQHLSPAPAVDPDWTSAAAFVLLGLVAAILGGAAFSRRDLVGA